MKGWEWVGNLLLPKLSFDGGFDAGVVGGASPVDPYWASVVLLLKAEGANGGTTWTDSSSKARTPQANSNVATTTAQAKYGTSSAHTTATPPQLHYASSTDFATSGDFTLDFWLRLESLPGAPFFLLARSAGSYCQIYNSAGTATFSESGFLPSGTAFSTGFTLGAWHHFALVCDHSGTNKIYLFKDGVVVGTPAATIAGSGSAFQFGILNIPGRTDLAGPPVDCYLDEIRYTTAVRWTSTFTPPAESVPTS